MKYGSVCSGIEAATVAWKPLGWEASWFSEIEPFPSAVLAHHYETPNLGDMTNFKEWPDAVIDVLVGGTPCQSFSVAGLRKGLDDPRGNLMLTYIAIALRYRPQWVVWENVPGVLSSNGGRDFASLLRGLEECGYGVAYRILDAQYFGVAQRRRRVFVVGCLGSWQRAAAVLFERDSLCGNPAPSRETRKEITSNTGEGIEGCFGIDEECNASDNHFGPLLRGGQGGTRQAVAFTPVHTTGAVFWQKGLGTLRAREQDSHENLLCMAHGQANAEIRDNHAPSLTCNHEAPIVTYGIPGNWIGRKPENGGNAVEPMIDVAPCQTKTDVHAVCYENHAQDARVKEIEIASLHAKAGTGGGNLPLCPMPGMQVRRLTPIECERLQGFPDGYTNIPWRNKPESPDGTRYKALGNSMAVPVMRWIGRRIQEVSQGA